jgi:hypothetical protein
MTTASQPSASSFFAASATASSSSGDSTLPSASMRSAPRAALALDQRTEGAAQAIGLRPRAAAELEHVAEALVVISPTLAILRSSRRWSWSSCRARRPAGRGLGTGRGERGHEAQSPGCRGGRHLGELDLARRRIDRQQVGEGAADIDADRERVRART